MSGSISSYFIKHGKILKETISILLSQDLVVLCESLRTRWDTEWPLSLHNDSSASTSPAFQTKTHVVFLSSLDLEKFWAIFWIPKPYFKEKLQFLLPVDLVWSPTSRVEVSSYFDYCHSIYPLHLIPHHHLGNLLPLWWAIITLSYAKYAAGREIDLKYSSMS